MRPSARVPVHIDGALLKQYMQNHAQEGPLIPLRVLVRQSFIVVRLEWEARQKRIHDDVPDGEAEGGDERRLVPIRGVLLLEKDKVLRGFVLL